MKKSLLLLFVFAALFILSCEKAETVMSLQGTWQLVGRDGGMIGNHPVGPGYGLKFTATEYQLYENGQVFESGSYTLNTEPGFNGTVMTRIIYGNRLPNSPKQFLQISKNTMKMYFGASIAADGLESVYEKKEINQVRL